MIQSGSAFVELKKDGKVIKGDLVDFKDVYHLTDVIVTGTMTKDESGNVFIDAKGIYVSAKSALDVATWEAAKKKANE